MPRRNPSQDTEYCTLLSRAKHIRTHHNCPPTQEWSSFLEGKKKKAPPLKPLLKTEVPAPSNYLQQVSSTVTKGSSPLWANLFKVDLMDDFNGSSAEMKIKGAINEIDDTIVWCIQQLKGRIFLWDPNDQNQLFSTYWLEEINEGGSHFFLP